MLARGTTLGRLAAANTSARTLPQLARVLHQALVARNASSFPAVRALSRAYQSACEARRSYATTTAATTPTATVKKAVKAKAASKAAPKKTVAATKAKKTTKTPAKKPAKKTAASKAKPKAKAKKAAPKKPAPKARVKKVLTPEQKAKAKISELRKIALREPVTASTLNAWNVFVAEHLQGKAEDGTSLVKRIPEVAAKFKNLTPADLEHYNYLARERTAAKLAEYQAWIRSHTPTQIHAANNARTQLRRLRRHPTNKRINPPHTSKLVDDRQVKRPVNAYARFNADRQATGDFKNIPLGDSAKLIAQEWKSLSAGEKKKFEDAAATDFARYKREAAALA